MAASAFAFSFTLTTAKRPAVVEAEPRPIRTGLRPFGTVRPRLLATDLVPVAIAVQVPLTSSLHLTESALALACWAQDCATAAVVPLMRCRAVGVLLPLPPAPP